MYGEIRYHEDDVGNKEGDEQIKENQLRTVMKTMGAL